MQSFAPLIKRRSSCQGAKSPIAFTPPAERGQWRSSENFLCKVLAHRKPAAALAEVAARLRDRLISIRSMAGGLVIRLLPQYQYQTWMWSSLPATGLQSALSRVNVKTTCLVAKLCATHCLCQLPICCRSAMRLLNCQHDCSRGRIHLVIWHVKVVSPSWSTRAKHPSAATSTGAVRASSAIPRRSRSRVALISPLHTIFGNPAQAADVHMDAYRSRSYHPSLSPTLSLSARPLLEARGSPPCLRTWALLTLLPKLSVPD
jgi:hypothetical protein